MLRSSEAEGRGPEPAVRRARVAVAAVFFSNGALFANVLPRYPEIKADLGLSNASLGAAIAAFPLGALLSGLTASALIARFRSARVATAGVMALAAAMFLVAVAPRWPLLAGAFGVAGAIDAVVDVAQNTHGLRVQRLYRRSINNSFHGVWSIGAVTGGLMGSAASGLQVPLGVHMGTVAVLFFVVAIVCSRALLPGPDGVDREASHPPSGRRWVMAARLLLPLGLIAAAAALVEDAGASWGALYLSGALGAGASLVGAAFVAQQAAMTIGRLLGDRAVDRFGPRAIAGAGGLLTALAMGTALLAPTTITTVVAFACSGLGFSTVVPATMHAADELPGLAPGVGLSVLSWLLRVGFLVSPPLVGVVADAISLRVGLLLAPLAGLVVAASSGVLPTAPPRLQPGSCR